MSNAETILSRNLAEVKERIGRACAHANRAEEEVTLVAVAKYVDARAVRILHELGVTDFGESRPQELWKKAAAVPDARWHLVGHLQRNKIDKTLPLVHLIHSVDSFRLLEAIEAEGQKQDRETEVLLEFNLSGETSKHGFSIDDEALIPRAVNPLRFVRVAGLMTMAALDATMDQTRRTFAALRQLRDRLELPSSNDGMEHSLFHLSMGMTNDFEVAIEEGATLVRIGTALFRGLEGVPS